MDIMQRMREREIQAGSILQQHKEDDESASALHGGMQKQPSEQSLSQKLSLQTEQESGLTGEEVEKGIASLGKEMMEASVQLSGSSSVEAQEEMNLRLQTEEKSGEEIKHDEGEFLKRIQRERKEEVDKLRNRERFEENKKTLDDNYKKSQKYKDQKEVLDIKEKTKSLLDLVREMKEKYKEEFSKRLTDLSQKLTDSGAISTINKSIRGISKRVHDIVSGFRDAYKMQGKNLFLKKEGIISSLAAIVKELYDAKSQEFTVSSDTLEDAAYLNSLMDYHTISEQEQSLEELEKEKYTKLLEGARGTIMFSEEYMKKLQTSYDSKKKSIFGDFAHVFRHIFSGDAFEIPIMEGTKIEVTRSDDKKEMQYKKIPKKDKAGNIVYDNFGDIVMVREEHEKGKEDHASGYHFEMTESSHGELVGQTEMVGGEGVYRSFIKVYSQDLCRYMDKKAASTFFPRTMTPEEVLNAIYEAYDDIRRNKLAPVNGETFIGIAKVQGKNFPIQMFIEKIYTPDTVKITVMQSELQEMRRKYQEERDTLERERAEFEAEKTQLEEELEQKKLEEGKSPSQEILSMLKREIDDLNKKIKEVKQNIKIRNKKITELQKKYGGASKTLDGEIEAEKKKTWTYGKIASAFPKGPDTPMIRP